jgi:hypothetical protein
MKLTRTVEKNCVTCKHRKEELTDGRYIVPMFLLEYVECTKGFYKGTVISDLEFICKDYTYRYSKRIKRWLH